MKFAALMVMLLVGRSVACLITVDELLKETSDFLTSSSIHKIDEQFDHIIQAEVEAAKWSTTHRTAFHHVSALGGSSPFTKRIATSSNYQLLILRQFRKQFELNAADIRYYFTHGKRIIQPCPIGLRRDGTPLLTHYNQCPYPTNIRCQPKLRYRTDDGSCNNLNNPLWGRSDTPHIRMVPADYEDGFAKPRASFSGEELPSARKVSNTVFNSRDRRSEVHTLLTMSIGQLIDHDLTRTPVFKLATKEDEDGHVAEVACGDGCSTEGPENAECFPIPVPADDAVFKKKKCLEFVRSSPTTADDCGLGVREQLNEVTSYLDASMVYGSKTKESKELRDLSDPDRGRLRMKPHDNTDFKSLLPPKRRFGDCEQINSTAKCFLAGDTRVNEQLGLTCVHTLFARYHNLLENRMHQQNPGWTGEKLYRETKKVVSAVWQHIVYDEFLPVLLGERTMNQFKLYPATGHKDSYNKRRQANTFNEFSTAAFRAGHSLIPEFVPFANNKYKRTDTLPLELIFEKPFMMRTGHIHSPGSATDGVIHGQLGTPAMAGDNSISNQLLNFLFTDNPGEPNADLMSLNIQRGRDHGVPGYTKFRKICGLGKIHTFDDLDFKPEVIKKLKSIYKRVEDIDVFPAGLLETAMPGAIVGPTFGCIIGKQFQSLKVGDRFFYERKSHITGFTEAQLKAIKKTTLSSVICETTEKTIKIQYWALLQTLAGEKKVRSKVEGWPFAHLYRKNSNTLRSCRRIRRLSLNAWRVYPSRTTSTSTTSP